MDSVKFAKELKGERIVLKEHPITFAHSQECFKIIERNRDIFEKYFPWASKTKTAEDHFKGFLMGLEGKMDTGEKAEYMVMLDNKFIGQVCIQDINLEDEQGDIGYWLDKAYTGHGYMSEAVSILEKHVFELGFNRISIHHASHNLASKKVIENLGYIFEGALRKNNFLDGDWRDKCIYSKLKSEYYLDKK